MKKTDELYFARAATVNEIIKGKGTSVARNKQGQFLVTRLRERGINMREYQISTKNRKVFERIWKEIENLKAPLSLSIGRKTAAPIAPSPYSYSCVVVVGLMKDIAYFKQQLKKENIVVSGTSLVLRPKWQM